MANETFRFHGFNKREINSQDKILPVAKKMPIEQKVKTKQSSKTNISTGSIKDLGSKTIYTSTIDLYLAQTFSSFDTFNQTELNNLAGYKFSGSYYFNTKNSIVGSLHTSDTNSTTSIVNTSANIYYRTTRDLNKKGTYYNLLGGLNFQFNNFQKLNVRGLGNTDLIGPALGIEVQHYVFEKALLEAGAYGSYYALTRNSDTSLNEKFDNAFGYRLSSALSYNFWKNISARLQFDLEYIQANYNDFDISLKMRYATYSLGLMAHF